MSLPRIAVIGTGGTISGVGADRLDLYEYGTSGRFMKVDELLATVPELSRIAEIVQVPYMNVASTAFGPTHWLAILKLIHQTAKADPTLAGIVVTHGTATLEETAYFLNLAVRVDVPVVICGAMRPSSALGADGGMNLLNAVRVAACPQSRGMGVLVMLNDEINAARDVAKVSNYRLNTFVSRDVGVLGSADGDMVEFYRKPLRRGAPDVEFAMDGLADLPRVDIIPAYAGADAVLVEAAVAAGAKGLVSAGLPSGSPSPAQLGALEAAVKRGVIVVQSSRSGSGRVIDTKVSLRKSGFLGGDSLTPVKARILLMLALTRTSDPEEIRRMFKEY
ncbi:asparaginase [Siccirubricoccus sp. KC 17139]|uniref:Asparaginase n=1 Tax=Siccirubricoccus soli TaxID=2899147 RepID=A0ABT1D8E0_9PROT|nr:asparaginase [Siccirubricoccus soli]MCO6418211.1 asparaginase [Siccirubricoccus soli]MCP2684346.1 asparaginase [Siccirubricoccus soli]